MSKPSPLISSKVAAFAQSGVSITVAARSSRLVPSISKAVGCRIAADLQQVTVLLFGDAAETVCRDIADHGHIAVCFSRPSTNETVQIKGRDARAAPASPTEVAVARRCLDLLVDDLLPLGFEREMIEVFFWGEAGDLMALSFTPDGAFAQTPGPSAGAALTA
jgi:hypothetical protein